MSQNDHRSDANDQILSEISTLKKKQEEIKEKGPMEILNPTKNQLEIMTVLYKNQKIRKQFLGPQILQVSNQKIKVTRYHSIDSSKIQKHFSNFSFPQLIQCIIDLLLGNCEISALYIQHMDHDFPNMVYSMESTIRRYKIIDFDISLFWGLTQFKQLLKFTKDQITKFFRERHLEGEDKQFTKEQQLWQFISHLQKIQQKPSQNDFFYHKNKLQHILRVQDFRSCYQYDLLKKLDNQQQTLKNNQKIQIHFWMRRMFFQEHDFQELLRLILKVISIVRLQDSIIYQGNKYSQNQNARKDQTQENQVFTQIMKLAASDDKIQDRQQQIAKKIWQYYSLPNQKQFNIKFAKTLGAYYGQRNPMLRQFSEITIIKLLQLFKGMFGNSNQIIVQPFMLDILQRSYISRMQTMETGVGKMRDFNLNRQKIQQIQNHIRQTKQQFKSLLDEYKLTGDIAQSVKPFVEQDKQNYRQFSRLFKQNAVIQSQIFAYHSQNQIINQEVRQEKLPEKQKKAKLKIQQQSNLEVLTEQDKCTSEIKNTNLMSKLEIQQQQRNKKIKQRTKRNNQIKAFFEIIYSIVEESKLKAIIQRTCYKHSYMQSQLCKYFIINPSLIKVKSELHTDRYLCQKCLQQFHQQLGQHCKIINLSSLSIKILPSQINYLKNKNTLSQQGLQQFNKSIEYQTQQFCNFTKHILQKPSHFHHGLQIQFPALVTVNCKNEIKQLLDVFPSSPIQLIFTLLNQILNFRNKLTVQKMFKFVQWLKTANSRYQYNLQQYPALLLHVLEILTNVDTVKQIFSPLIEQYRNYIERIAGSIQLKPIQEEMCRQNIITFQNQQDQGIWANQSQEIFQNTQQLQIHSNKLQSKETNIYNNKKSKQISNQIKGNDYQTENQLNLSNKLHFKQKVLQFVSQNQFNLRVTFGYAQKLQNTILEMQEQFKQKYTKLWEIINSMVKVINMNPKRSQLKQFLWKFVTPNQVIQNEKKMFLLINYYFYREQQAEKNQKNIYKKNIYMEMIQKKINDIEDTQKASINALTTFNRNRLQKIIQAQVIGKSYSCSHAIINNGKIQFKDIQDFQMSLQEFVQCKNASNKVITLQITNSNATLSQKDIQKIKVFNNLKSLKCEDQTFNSNHYIHIFIENFQYLHHFQLGQNSFCTAHAQKMIKKWINIPQHLPVILDIFNLSKLTVKGFQSARFHPKSFPPKTSEQSKIYKFIFNNTGQKDVEVNLQFVKIHPGVMLRVLATNPMHFTFIVHNGGTSTYFRQLFVLQKYIKEVFGGEQYSISKYNSDTVLYLYMINYLRLKLPYIQTLDIYFDNYSKNLINYNNFIFQSILTLPITNLRTLILNHIQIPKQRFNSLLTNNRLLFHLQINHCKNISNSFFKYIPQNVQHLILKVNDDFFGHSWSTLTEKQYSKLTYEINVKKLTQLVITNEKPYLSTHFNFVNALSTFHHLEVLILHGWSWIDQSLIIQVSKMQSLQLVSIQSKFNANKIKINPLLTLPNLQTLSLASLDNQYQILNNDGPFFQSPKLAKLYFRFITFKHKQGKSAFIKQLGEMPNLTHIIIKGIRQSFSQKIELQYQSSEKNTFKSLRVFELNGKNIACISMPNSINREEPS